MCVVIEKVLQAHERGSSNRPVLSSNTNTPRQMEKDVAVMVRDRCCLECGDAIIWHEVAS
jgi:hypothetical protein